MFSFSRTVFCAVFLSLIALAGPVLAQEATYTITGVTVDVTAENALAARDQAFAQAQIQAFSQIAKQLLPAESASLFIPPDVAVISPMVQDFEITQEKLSAVRYIATYTFRFQEAAVQNYLGTSQAQSIAQAPTENLPPVTPVSMPQAQNRSVLVIPFYRHGGQTMLWNENNPWLKALANDGGGQGVILIAPIGDLADVKDIAQADPAQIDSSGLANMQARYGAQEAVLAAAEMADNGALSIDLYRGGGWHRAAPSGQIVLTRKMGQSQESLLAEAAAQLREHLAGGAAAPSSIFETARAPAMPGAITVAVHFNSLQEWAAIQQRLGRIPMLANRVILSLSTGQALLSLPVQGSIDVLQMAMNQLGMSLNPDMNAPGSYTLALLP